MAAVELQLPSELACRECRLDTCSEVGCVALSCIFWVSTNSPRLPKGYTDTPCSSRFGVIFWTAFLMRPLVSLI